MSYQLVDCCLAAAFGRLCVETAISRLLIVKVLAAAFGRLCVETTEEGEKQARAYGSRLRAAVC